MFKKVRYSLNLQLFAEEGAATAEAGAAEVGTGVEEASAAGEQSQGEERAATQTGVEDQAAAEPGKQNNFEKAFAKRLAAEREKWEADRAKEMERYKDFDAYKRATEYLQKTAGIDDLMTLQEEIELAELQERAKKENVPATVLKRIDQLEAKAAKADELEAQQAQAAERSAFEQTLKEFCADKQIDGKPVDHGELWKFMHENEIGKPEAALKAMRAEIAEAKLATARDDAVKEYLKSKEAPRAEGAAGSTAAAQQAPPPVAETWEAAEKRALERLRASREQV